MGLSEIGKVMRCCETSGLPNFNLRAPRETHRTCKGRGCLAGGRREIAEARRSWPLLRPGAEGSTLKKSLCLLNAKSGTRRP